MNEKDIVQKFEEWWREEEKGLPPMFSGVLEKHSVRLLAQLAFMQGSLLVLTPSDDENNPTTPEVEEVSGTPNTKGCGCTNKELTYDGGWGFEQKWTMCRKHAEEYKKSLAVLGDTHTPI